MQSGLEAGVRVELLAVAASALVIHVVFNRYEPIGAVPLASFLVVAPGASALFLAGSYGLSGFFLGVSTFYATLVTSIVLYRISPWHGLARYPGPLLAKVSRWYWAWIALQGSQHLELYRLHEELGDIVRIGPNEVSIRDVRAIQPMMGAQGWPKGPMWVGRMLHPPILALIAHRDNAEHARRRRPWTRALSSAALKEYQPMIFKRISELVNILAQEKNVNLAQWTHFFTFDVMMDTLFSSGSNMMAERDKDGVMHAMIQGFADSQIFENIPWAGYYAKYIPHFVDSVKKYRALCLKQGLARYEKGSTTKDLFYYLNNEDRAEEQSPSKPVVISDAALAIIAGSDTTAVAICHTVFCLLTHPEAYTRLVEEVDRFYPTGEDSLDPTHQSKMPYLEAVINEALRVYPVTMSGSQRAPSAGSGGGFLGQYFIPEGTQTRVHTWSVHRDPRNFSRPDEYWPDRWLIAEGLQTSPEPLVHNLNAYIPFSFGPYNCVGKNMAMLELRTVICHMVQKLRLRFQDGWDPSNWERTMEDRFITKMGKLPLVVEPR